MDSSEQLPTDIIELPAYSLYFGERWEAYVATLRAAPILTTVGSHSSVEHEILAVGESSFRDGLTALGLTADDLPNREAYVHVSEPRWLAG